LALLREKPHGISRARAHISKLFAIAAPECVQRARERHFIVARRAFSISICQFAYSACAFARARSKRKSNLAGGENLARCRSATIFVRLALAQLGLPLLSLFPCISSVAVRNAGAARREETLGLLEKSATCGPVRKARAEEEGSKEKDSP